MSSRRSPGNDAPHRTGETPSLKKCFAIITVISAVVVGLATVPDLWLWTTTDVTYERWGDRVTRIRSKRTSSRNPTEPMGVLAHSWLTKNGMLVRTDHRSRYTIWSESGALLRQVDVGPDPRVRTSPPWWWGETDQTHGTSPWIVAGLSLDEWWESLPGSRKISHVPPSPKGPRSVQRDW